MERQGVGGGHQHLYKNSDGEGDRELGAKAFKEQERHLEGL